MNLLPQFTPLGKLNIIEVYESFDEPCLFSCKNASGQIYMSVLIDEDENYKTWLYVSVSKRRFNYIRSGGIDLHDCFKLAEDETVQVVKVPFLNSSNACVTVFSCESLSKNMLPLRGELLQLETQTLTILPIQELKLYALAQWRDILRFSVKIPKYKRNEAPLKLWSFMLTCLQEAIDEIGLYLFPSKTSVSQKFIKQQTNLLASATSGGSYAIDLIAEKGVDVLRDSLIGESLIVFFDLIQSSSINNEGADINIDNQNFTEKLNSLDKKIASKFRKFLVSVADAESDVDFNWGSPHPDRGGSVSLTYTDAMNSLSLMNSLEFNDPKTLEIIGILVGGNVESKKFEFRDIYENFKYKGKIADSLFANDIDMTLQNIYMEKESKNLYKATIEETLEVNQIMGLVKPKYRLINLELLKLEKENTNSFIS